MAKLSSVHHVIPSLAYVDLAWAEGNIGLAQEHADRAFSLAIKSGNPYLQVYASGLPWSFSYRRRKAHLGD